MLATARDGVDRADQVLGEALDALSGREVVQVQLILDVDRVEEDECGVVCDMQGGEKSRGVVGDEIRETLSRRVRSRRQACAAWATHLLGRLEVKGRDLV